MMTRQFFLKALLFPVAFATAPITTKAQDVYWQGGNSRTAFHADENWEGGVAPLNDSTPESGQVAVFGVQALGAESSLLGSRSIAGLRFEGMRNLEPWIIRRGRGDADTLTIGSKGIHITKPDTEILFDCNLRIHGNQRWIFTGENSVLNVEGDVTGPSFVSILGPGRVGFRGSLETGGLVVSGATVEIINSVQAPEMQVVLGNSGTLQLTVEEFSAGTLALPSSARIVLAPGVKTVRFADSRNTQWESGELTIEGFHPEKTKIVFGDSAEALTPGQLKCIRFDNPAVKGPPTLSPQGELLTR